MPLQTTTSRPAFGRRVAPLAAPAAPEPPARAAEAIAETPIATAITADTPEQVPVDQELQAWKDARGSQFKVPWSQVYLMASLCFGIASFVLPDSVNDGVDYLLWALMAMSAYAWFTTRKKKAESKEIVAV